MCRSHLTFLGTATAMPVAASYLSSVNPLRKFRSTAKIDAAPDAFECMVGRPREEFRG